MLRIVRLLSRLVFQIQPKILKNRMNLHYTNPRTICCLSVRCKYTTCCACLSSRHLTQLHSNDTVDPHIASHSMSFYLRDCTPFTSHFVESRITYNRDRMDYIEIIPSPTSPLHLK